MKKKFLSRMFAVSASAVIAAGTCVMFAGCTSSHPQVTITYTFNGTDYEVEYTLSRSDAPTTVQHFIDLADAGYYDGTCIHDYDSSYLYGGGYYFDDHNVLTEKDYFAVVKQLEREGHSFAQSVFTQEGKLPLYTVYGEFSKNGNKLEGRRENSHSKGALVMYYTDKTESASDLHVMVTYNDGTGDHDRVYSYNSATSLFYTYLGSTNSARDEQYTVFGKTVDYEGDMQPLLDAISDFCADLEDDETTEEDESSFTTDTEMVLDELDHHTGIEGFEDIAPLFEGVRKGGTRVTYHVPHDAPIIIKSVRVTKY